MSSPFFSIIIPVYNGLTHDLPICLELDALSRVPTVSPIVFQIVFDVLALYASGHINGLDAQGFLKNHPGGDIGKFLRTI